MQRMSCSKTILGRSSLHPLLANSRNQPKIGPLDDFAVFLPLCVSGLVMRAKLWEIVGIGTKDIQTVNVKVADLDSDCYGYIP